MHRSLLIHEIVERIAEHLYKLGGLQDDSHLSSVLNFALTCRAFCDPALDVLWRSLDGPYPLAFIFQPNVQPIRGPSSVDDDDSDDNLDDEENGEDEDDDGFDGNDTVIGLSQIPTTADWERATSYIKRIRSLRYIDDSELRYRTSPRFLAELLAYRPPGVLIPNLQTLGWYHSSKMQFPFISLFLSPTLTSIEVYLKSNANARKLWNFLHSSTPALQKLTVIPDGFIASAATQAAFSRALPSWQDLTSLKLPDNVPISIDDLITLSRCDKLRTLYIAPKCNPVSSLDSQFTSENYFLSLQDLHLHISSTNILLRIADMIKAIRSHGFKSFTLDIESPYTSVELNRILGAVAMHRQLNILRTSLENRSSIRLESGEDSDMLVTSATIEPIFHLTDLVEFRMEQFYLQPTKELLDKMARAWPKIKVLECSCRRSATTNHFLTSTVDISDLQILAEFCPNLETLSIPFSSTLHKDVSDLPVRRTSGIALFLDVGECRIDNPVTTAIYLTCLFPQVTVLSFSHILIEQQLRDALEVVNRTRAQERRYGSVGEVSK